MAIGGLREKLRARFSRRSSMGSSGVVVEAEEGAGEEEANADAEGAGSERDGVGEREGEAGEGGRMKTMTRTRRTANVRVEGQVGGEGEGEGEGGEKGQGNGGVLYKGRDGDISESTTTDTSAGVEAGAGLVSSPQRTSIPTTTTTTTTTDALSTTTTAIPAAGNASTTTTISDFTSTRFTLPEYPHDSTSTADLATPNTDVSPLQEEDEEAESKIIGSKPQSSHDVSIALNDDPEPQLNLPSSILATAPRPTAPPRRQSLLPHQQTTLIRTLLATDLPPPTQASHADYFTTHGPATISATMVSRKIWVRRPGASPTLVTIHEDDLVDDVRDMILRKYANSLGRAFDAPDVTLRIISRETRQERLLGPEEPMGRTLDAYFPGGQLVEEALVIDVPMRRTPRPSPQAIMRSYYDHEGRPAEGGTDYFPPMPVHPLPSPRLSNALLVGAPNGHSSLTTHSNHSMSVLTTGHVPSLPSPGSSRRHHRDGRPRAARQHTSSPTILNGGHSASQVPTLSSGTSSHMQAYTIPLHPRGARSRTHSSASEASAVPPTAPPLPTPPPALNAQSSSEIQRVATPPPRTSSPRPTRAPRQRKNRKAAAAASGGVDHSSFPTGMLNGAVPPISVLIVEDNIINLKLLEAFMKRLKVRWQTAMNGRDAVVKWRAGGFHLVLMDIQLPIMSGLEATKEIRRLERLNNIGVFRSGRGGHATLDEVDEEDEDGQKEKEGVLSDEKDRLPSSVLFKSPVIIVALTASSLQSDRHEALAAGCNDFLTKPVNFVWLERKVMEWGCMQALIDFDGWRKWKDFSQNGDSASTTGGDSGPAVGGTGTGAAGTGAAAGAKKSEKKRKGKMTLGSLGASGAGAGGSASASAARVPIEA